MEDGRDDSNSTQRKTALEFRLYKRRWFMLLVLCLLNCSNSVLWLTFAPVADQTAEHLHVTLDQVNWLSVVYMVVAIPLSFITTWMLDTWGLRPTMILGSWLNMAGGVLRVVGVLSYLPEYTHFPIVMAGQTLCSLAQPLVIFSPTKLAALWFPEHQRTTANMIASMSNPLGLLFVNIFSPLILSRTNSLFMLLLIYAIPAFVICCLATVGIQESVPPTPPSASADSSSSEPFLQGIKLLLKNKAYMILLVCFGSGIGIFTCFSTLLEQILCVKGYANDFAGLCGALFIVFGVLGAAILGYIVDKTKLFTECLKISMCLTSLACTMFAVVSQLRDQKIVIGLVCAFFGLFGFATYPVAMELSVECSYPVGEATSAGLVFISGQIQSIVYTMLLQALTTKMTDSSLSVCAAGDDASLSWMVPVLVMAGLCCLASCSFVIFFHTQYRRLNAEAEVAEKHSAETETQRVMNNSTDA
ncbi:solute carrier family 49 member A3 [Tachysurus fulvidraco]|uniref:solute carrier family 49 member A3 n=1 Tax=Tachysurus fulvidraco TaxID=1234273 RepID=UPI000F4E6283|nr:solute carrier family 49 member A3 [Tachysurus fulvidraco]